MVDAIASGYIPQAHIDGEATDWFKQELKKEMVEVDPYTMVGNILNQFSDATNEISQNAVKALKSLASESKWFSGDVHRRRY